MNVSSPPLINLSPGIAVMVPLLYAAWSDRVLTPTEARALRKRAADLPFLTDDDRRRLLAWSNPAKPPTRDLFQMWQIACKEAVETLGEENVQNLVDLGLVLARGAVHTTNGVNWDDPQLRRRLDTLEESLRRSELRHYRNLFPESGRQQQWSEEVERAGVSAEAMQALLDGPYGETKQRMRVLLSDPVFRPRTLQLKEDYREQVLEWLHILARQGIGALSFPEAYGGRDDMGNYAAAFEMLGYQDLSLTIKFGVQFGLWGGSVLWLGQKRHHDAYLRDIGTMQLPGCFAMTETGHGSNVRGLETTATYDPQTDEFIINTPDEQAGKEYIGNALHGKMGSVFAQLIVDGENHGVHALVVPLRDESDKPLPGIRIVDSGYKLGLNGVDNGRIWFDRVRVPRANLLDRFGTVNEKGVYHSPIDNPSRRFFTMLGTLVGGRVCVPRAGLSATKTALTIAVRYALRRRQFAPLPTEPETLLLDYPSHQRRLMPLLAKTYALHFGLDYLLDRFVKHVGEDLREIETMAAGMKAYATWFTTECIQECREACGGKGYLAENRFAALKADTDIFTTFEGDNTVLMQLVAKGVLADFRKEFMEEGNLAILRQLGRRITTAITERNPYIIRNTNEEHLLDSAFHLAAFRYRESKLLLSLAQRLRGRIKDGETAHEAGLHAQTHMIALAEAYIERIVLEQFTAVIEAAQDQDTQLSLAKLCQLYALHTIEKHKGWYLEEDYISGGKSKAIRRQIDALCAELRESAGVLVSAFGIPDELLAAPIAV